MKYNVAKAYMSNQFFSLKLTLPELTKIEI